MGVSMSKVFSLLLALFACLAASPSAAQDDPGVEPSAPSPVLEGQPAAVPDAATAGPTCELHVWPTDNYIGINTGLLSGFGLVGAIADVAAHDGRVKTVKELMADYLGPEVQMAELNRIGLRETLKLPANYRIIVEEPTPFNEDLKDNPELKAKVKQMNETIKAGKRLSASTSPCYAELVTTHVFYHKAMMYGSNLFVGWIYRDFGDKPVALKVGKGQVKNPLENFPPKSPEMVSVAQAELRDAFAKDFTEYVEKKVKP